MALALPVSLADSDKRKPTLSLMTDAVTPVLVAAVLMASRTPLRVLPPLSTTKALAPTVIVIVSPGAPIVVVPESTKVRVDASR